MTVASFLYAGSVDVRVASWSCIHWGCDDDADGEGCVEAKKRRECVKSRLNSSMFCDTCLGTKHTLGLSVHIRGWQGMVNLDLGAITQMGKLWW